jgi:hypothetical protein
MHAFTLLLTQSNENRFILNFIIRFLNSFIESSPTDREKVHIQSELEEAGLDIAPLKKLLSQV